MVVTNETKDDVKANVIQTISDEFQDIVLGTGSSTPSVGDTSLDSQVFQDDRQSTGTYTDRIIISGFVNSGTGNSNTFKEMGFVDSTGTLQSRNLIEPVEKTSSKELWIDEEIKANITQS